MDTADEPTAGDHPRICKYDTLPGDILHIESPRAQRLIGWLKTWYHRTLVEVIIIYIKMYKISNNKQIYLKLEYTLIKYTDLFCYRLPMRNVTVGYCQYYLN